MRSGRPTRRGSSLTAIVLGASLCVARPTVAQESSALEDARWAFVEGGTHYEARRYEQALAAFQTSYAKVQSPNALLMLARCERELGRKADAALTFERAAQDAKRRVAAGEPKYAPTAQAAADEGQRLRAGLGTLRIRVEGSGATLKADGRPVALSADGEALIFREPGTATVELVATSGARQKQTVSVAAGSTFTMTFSAEAAGPPVVSAPVQADKREPTTPRRGWATPAAIVAGGVALAGAGAFVGFGLSSQSTYDRLKERCGQSPCAPNLRDDADRGARSQMLANVSLGVAITAAVATVVFVVLALESQPAAAPPKADAHLSGAGAILW